MAVQKPHTFVNNTPADAPEVNANFDVIFQALNQHLDAKNPHNVTAADVGAPTTTEFNNHVADTDNPHDVSPEQIGAETPAGAQAKADAAEQAAKAYTDLRTGDKFYFARNLVIDWDVLIGTTPPKYAILSLPEGATQHDYGLITYIEYVGVYGTPENPAHLVTFSVDSNFLAGGYHIEARISGEAVNGASMKIAYLLFPRSIVLPGNRPAFS